MREANNSLSDDDYSYCNYHHDLLYPPIATSQSILIARSIGVDFMVHTGEEKEEERIRSDERVTIDAQSKVRYYRNMVSIQYKFYRTMFSMVDSILSPHYLPIGMSMCRF